MQFIETRRIASLQNLSRKVTLMFEGFTLTELTPVYEELAERTAQLGRFL